GSDSLIFSSLFFTIAFSVLFERERSIYEGRSGWSETGFLREYWLIAFNLGKNPVSWAQSINHKDATGLINL
ncbi:hypothetical protein, partial [Microcoleus sp. Pol10D4]|uniref:hypothetical protein n=1 Tax=Microcoleus sp. Pol10D4 TaxID=3055387 RepID=UPI002FD23312